MDRLEINPMTPQPDPNEVKPCPFCGEAGRAYRWQDESLSSHAMVEYMQIECIGCEAVVKGSEDHDEVIKAWNRRSSPSQPDQSMKKESFIPITDRTDEEFYILNKNYENTLSEVVTDKKEIEGLKSQNMRLFEANQNLLKSIDLNSKETEHLRSQLEFAREAFIWINAHIDDSTSGAVSWKMVKKVKDALSKLSESSKEEVKAQDSVIYGQNREKIFTHKYLDPTCCESGCRSLVLQSEVERLKKLLEQPSYQTTLDLLAESEKENVELEKEVKFEKVSSHQSFCSDGERIKQLESEVERLDKENQDLWKSLLKILSSVTISNDVRDIAQKALSLCTPPSSPQASEEVTAEEALEYLFRKGLDCCKDEGKYLICMKIGDWEWKTFGEGLTALEAIKSAMKKEK